MNGQVLFVTISFTLQGIWHLNLGEDYYHFHWNEKYILLPWIDRVFICCDC